MTSTLRIACAQLNPVVGDLAGNAALARAARAEARGMAADLVVFPELFIAGYPPEDLILKPAFVGACMEAVRALAAATADGGPALLVGTPWGEDGNVCNAIALLAGGRIEALRYKVELPNYSVFDEKRVFAPGPLPEPVSFAGLRLGLPICEDIWTPAVAGSLAARGADLLISPNGSPFTLKKCAQRLDVARARVAETGLPLLYINQFGGQDELVFDGASFALNRDGALAAQLPAWETSLALTEWRRDASGWACASGPDARVEEGSEAAYLACVTGLRDYVEKNRFPGVVLGLSGGIDSALCAAMATDALGAARVHCIMLPYRYTSNASLDDAEACAEALGVRYEIVPIHAAVEAFSGMLAPLFKDAQPGLAEENLQSRIRGTTLMAVSNKFGGMVVTTGNKSEVSAGYATLYGDMNGGFNPVKDLYKTQVFALSRFRNEHVPMGCLGPGGIVIPETVITKAPTAELRENQRDQDSLPPYDVLDDILESLVDREEPLATIVARGHAPDTVKKVERLLYLSEYKRRQAAPGVKITERNFGRDRRYPIVNRFRETVG
ncbi:NAD+ synthase [Rhodomicrobium sp. Az07]|uniref:NAD+ synthase n=1 Tax=Rhodomicrobium sp. Az07 TaxID=2839034 RepID=UPI001BED0B34|nr:NAD+ synthase [Rhodomicrobium sp. Az07]MBT3071919.1 NAD+ synthase [Rhodomicrobium sp. Az07]